MDFISSSNVTPPCDNNSSDTGRPPFVLTNDKVHPQNAHGFTCVERNSGGFAMPMAIIQMMYKEQALFSQAFCKYMSLIDIFICKVCSLHILFMAVDRYWAVCRPLFHRTLGLRTGFVMVGLSWLIPFVITALCDLFDWVVVENGKEGCVDVCEVKHNNVLSIGGPFVTSFIPFLMICVLYLLILIEIKKFHDRKRNKFKPAKMKTQTKSSTQMEALRKSIWFIDFSKTFGIDSAGVLATSEVKNANTSMTSKQEVPHECSLPQATATAANNKNAKHHQRSRSNNKAFLTIGLLISSCIVCWLPFAIFMCIHGLNKGIQFPIWTIVLFSWLGYCNSALSPLLFCCHQSMKTSLKMLISTLETNFISRRIKCG
ncbi:hypothetical protein Btru_050928 [Bulinus truncatus]|nr:hypothetical protein Btru_050928 [Bulinus truncatus]